jgi:hypothetical protein
MSGLNSIFVLHETICFRNISVTVMSLSSSHRTEEWGIISAITSNFIIVKDVATVTCSCIIDIKTKSIAFCRSLLYKVSLTYMP